MNTKFLALITLLFPMFLWANSGPGDDLFQAFRQTPSFVSGNIRMQNNYICTSGVIEDAVLRFDLRYGVRINRNEDIHFAFNEQFLEINTRDALTIELRPMFPDIKVRSLRFDARSRTFRIRTDTRFNLGEERANRLLESIINRKYKSKVEEAFRQLAILRRQGNLNDAHSVMETMLEIFKHDGRGQAPLPQVTGDLNLVINPRATQNVELGNLRARILSGDTVTLGVNFTRTIGRASISGLSFTSRSGIRVSPQDSRAPELQSIEIRSAALDRSGLHLDYDIGAEQAITGLMAVIELFRATATRRNINIENCSRVELAAIRNSLEGQFQVRIGELVRRYERRLLEYGIHPRLIEVLKG